ncbi:Hypothetical predicted protein [Lecanosticta acicola]|uniref:Uncharacterized protein n=1 Tax=Lecanosticta acicola TaxID=111012 RepID=A0AAI8YT93_9PEZI|nr:Hypothetical predicted protein [Lecanosticta acicola]
MKARTGVAAAVAVAGAAAQVPASYGPGVPSSAPVSYTTVTVDDCPTSSLAVLITVTSGTTVTYCPECEHQTQPAPTGPGYTTTYTTVYQSLCPTGLVPATYTVTESCTDDKPTFTPGPDHIPNGFTVTVKECSVCDKTQPHVTITEPCGCEATKGTSVGPAKTPAKPTPTGGNVQQISDGQVQVPTGAAESPAPPAPPAPQCNGDDCGGSGSQSPGTSAPAAGNTPAAPGSSGAASPPECNGDDCGGAGSQSPGTSAPAAGNTPAAPGSSGAASPPYPTTTSIQCPGPECRAKATGGAAAPVPSGGSPVSPGDSGSGSGSGSSASSSAPIEPAPSGYEGAAASIHAGYLASIALSVIVGGLAFAL